MVDHGTDDEADVGRHVSARAVDVSRGTSVEAVDGASGASRAASVLRLQATAGNQATVRWLARERLLQREIGWWAEKVASVSSAVRHDKNFVGYPDGAFWIINPLNDNDRGKIMTHLDHSDLDQLIDRGGEAEAAGVPHAKNIVAEAKRARDASRRSQLGWWEEKAAAVHVAIHRAENFVRYPEGAFWIINGLNEDDRAKIMTHIDRGDLEQIVEHADDAKTKGVPHAKDIVAKATAARDATRPAKSTWWGKKSAAISSAIRAKDPDGYGHGFVDFPDGAFWIINGLNDDDRAEIMTHLDREDLDALITNGFRAYSVKVPHATDIVTKATEEVRSRGFTPRAFNAEGQQEPLPETPDHDYRRDPEYIDNIVAAVYDTQSKTFWGRYEHGPDLQFDLWKILKDSDWTPDIFSAHGASPAPWRPLPSNLITFHRGRGSKIWPSVITASSMPNLVDCARQTREVLPRAEDMQRAGLSMLEMQKTSLEAAIAGKVVGGAGGRFVGAWRAPTRGAGARAGAEGEPAVAELQAPGGKTETPGGKTEAPGGKTTSTKSESGTTTKLGNNEKAFDKATAARDQQVQTVKDLPKSKRQEIATVTAGTNVETGETAAGWNQGGRCAEDVVVGKLGGDASKIRFSKAIRPRTNQEVPVCQRCQGKYTKDQFPDGTKFQ